MEGHQGIYVDPEGQNTIHNPNKLRLEDALKYEGDTMGHCVGGYTPDVASGKSRIFSLRDAKNEPHVTIETKPREKHPIGYGMSGAEEFPKDFRYEKGNIEPEQHQQIYQRAKQLFNPQSAKDVGSHHMDVFQQAADEVLGKPPEEIVQIKGKGNAKPKQNYIPFVQDFVKSGKWSDVGDLEHAELIPIGNGKYANESETKKHFEPRVKNAINFLQNHPAFKEQHTAKAKRNKELLDLSFDDQRKLEGIYGQPIYPKSGYSATELLNVIKNPEENIGNRSEYYPSLNSWLGEAEKGMAHHGYKPEQKAQGGTVHMADGGDMDQMMLELMRRHMSGGGSFTTKGFVTHTPKNLHPEVGTRFVAQQLPGLMPEHDVDLDRLHREKASIQLRPWDATNRNVKVSNVSGHDLINPLYTEGGQGFARDIELNKEGIAGGSDEAIQGRIQNRANTAHEENIKQGGRGHTYDVITNMDYLAPLFTHMPLHIQLDLMHQRGLSHDQMEEIANHLRKMEVKNPKTKKVTTPYKDLLPLNHPALMDQLIHGTPGSDKSPRDMRKALSTTLASVKNQQLLDYNLPDLINSITDPHIRQAPATYAGNTFLSNVPYAGLGPQRHKIYNTTGYGEYEGKGPQAPAELYVPDVYDKILAEMQAKYPKAGASSLRSMTMGALQKRGSGVSQMVNDRVLRNIDRFNQGIKSGEIEKPNDLYHVIGHFVRKYGGHAKGGPIRMADGGQVDVTSIGVNEAPNMDVKAFFPPRPATSGVLPVGGIQQAQQAPMQPQQPQPGMPGQPQQPPMQPNQPQPGQQLQQQQPSNILQMTRQGQAMNAMTPPKPMARGGHVDRDTMMLALMNRQMARR